MTDDSVMTDPVRAAAARLRGHLVATPVVGGAVLPGFALPAGARLKLECLQPGGTAMFRGYTHALLRSLGRFKGVVLHGDPRQIRAQACAAMAHRLPAVAVADAPLPESLAQLLHELGLEAVPGDPVEHAANRGFVVMPGCSDSDVLDGLATLGLELADELPLDTSRVLVAPSVLAAPVRRGLAAGGRDTPVAGVDRDPGVDFAALAGAVLDQLRVASDPEGLAALWAGCHSTDEGLAVVLSC